MAATCVRSVAIWPTALKQRCKIYVRSRTCTTALRQPVATVVHSDRGSQFRATAYLRTPKDNGLISSTGRVGACDDNATMESFLALQKNVLDRQCNRTVLRALSCAPQLPVI